MSNIIEFEKDYDYAANAARGIGTLDGSIAITIPRELPLTGVVMQVNAITMSDLIPNVYNAYPIYRWDNTKVVVSTNLVAPVTIRMRVGLYGSAELFAAEINKAITDNLHWWLDPTRPGLTMTSDTVHNKVIIAIDSNHLNPLYGAYVRLDMRYATSQTDLALTLGFSEATALVVSPPAGTITVESDLEPNLDTQGTVADILCNLATCRIRNNTRPQTLARIIFAGKNTLSDNIWPPSGQVSPYMLYGGAKQVNHLDISVRTRDGYPMFFMGGYLHVSIGFYAVNAAGTILPITIN